MRYDSGREGLKNGSYELLLLDQMACGKVST